MASKLTVLSATATPKRRVTRRGSQTSVCSPISSFIRSQHKRQGSVLSTRIRMRKSQPVQLDTAVVSEVVNSCIIPMLESDARAKNERLRRSSMGLNENTAYAELKLSQRLTQEKEALNSQLQAVTQRCTDLEQRNFAISNEFSQLAATLANTEATLHALNTQFSQQTVVANSEVTRLRYDASLSHEYKLLFEEQRRLHDCTAKQLMEERALNDKLCTHTTGLQQELSLLLTGNAVLGERLKGLCSAFDALHIAGDVKASAELAALLHSAQGLKSALDHYESLADTRQVKHDFYRNAANELGDSVDSLTSKLNGLHKGYKDQFLQLSREHKELLQHNLALNEQNEILSGKLNLANQEVTALRRRLKATRGHNSAAEKICRNCNQSYFEETNFNWSCKRHLAPFSGEVYFCCGKQHRDAPGCEQSAHLSNEGENSSADDTENRVEFCSSCAETGHRNEDCPKDPNVRTNYYPDLEQERIDRIQLQRQHHQATERKNTIRERMIKLVGAPRGRDTEESDGWGVLTDNANR